MTNLYAGIPVHLREEFVSLLHHSPQVRIERIVSRQHATPPDRWYDQETDEYVVLLAGSAGLRIDGNPDTAVMKPGDAILLPAHLRHRVEWTDPARDTIWLAVHVTHS